MLNEIEREIEIWKPLLWQCWKTASADKGDRSCGGLHENVFMVRYEKLSIYVSQVSFYCCIFKVRQGEEDENLGSYGVLL